MLTPFPPVDLRRSTANPFQSVTNNPPAPNVPIRNPPDLRHLPTHFGPLRRPPIVDLFIPRRPLQDFIPHEREDTDRTYRRQRARHEIYYMRNGSAPSSVEAYVTGPYSRWLDARRFYSMPIHCDASEASRGIRSRSETWTKRWLHRSNQTNNLPLDSPRPAVGAGT